MSSTDTYESLSEVAELAVDTPVVCKLSDLETRILETNYDVTVCPDIETFWRTFESPTELFDDKVVVNDVTDTPDLDDSLTTYTPPTSLPIIEYTEDVYNRSLNEYISRGALSWQDVEEATLCQSDITDHLVNCVDGYDAVALVIVDGLSYTDWVSYGGTATPVYVDCPTITECGYPNVVHPSDQSFSIATRLHKKGFRKKGAYTYWEKQYNTLTEQIHEPFSPNEVKGDVESFRDVRRDLKRRPVDDSTYIQITLTGPERVAHQIKEDPYVDNQVEQVKDKLADLNAILTEQTDNHLIFATADHGILWRMTTDFDVLNDESFESTDRRHLSGTATQRSLSAKVGLREQYRGIQYYRLLYPYLFHELRSNEPGVHGGYSCEESIVPLIKIEESC